MAKPIAPTPTLYGDDANAFVKKMLKPATKKEIKFAKNLKAMFKNHDPLIKDNL